MSADAYDGNGNRHGATSDDFYSYADYAPDTGYLGNSEGGKRASSKNRRALRIAAKRAHRNAGRAS